MSIIKVFYSKRAHIDSWLRERVPMPKGLELEWFDDSNAGEKPTLCTAPRIDDIDAFEKYLASDHWLDHLYARKFKCMYGFSRTGSAELDFSDMRDDSNALLRHARDILKYFGERGADYGFACLYEEYFHRNLHRYDLWGSGKYGATFILGSDFTRYVPGLYWMTYLSSEYCKTHNVNIDGIVVSLAAKREVLPAGQLLTLFDDPEEWEQHKDPIDAYLFSDRSFFCMGRIERLPPGLSPIEYRHRSDKLQKEWP